MEIAIIILCCVCTIISIVTLVICLTKKEGNVDIKGDLSTLRSEIDTKISNSSNTISTNVSNSIIQNNQSQKDAIDTLTNTVNTSLNGFKEELAEIRKSTDERLMQMMAANDEKLNKINETVNEKLESSLQDKLNKSFEMLQNNLKSVSEALGRMNSVADEVNGLNKILSGSKTKGIFGEVQLKFLLEEVLSHDQYEENIVTKKGSRDPVEFAVKFPGTGEGTTYLPIDSKFYVEPYRKLYEAQEACDETLIKQALAEFRTSALKAAGDIQSKYIDVPRTTDFGVMFVPTEGIYAELIKNNIADEIRAKYRVIVSGPTTMAALLNSFQMGFRSLAIQKNANQVYEVLREIEAEFTTYSEALQKVQSDIQKADKSLNTLMTTRTNVMNKKLNLVQQLPYGDNSNGGE